LQLNSRHCKVFLCVKATFEGLFVLFDTYLNIFRAPKMKPKSAGYQWEVVLLSSCVYGA
jgi:hypothetical protein